MSQKTMDILKEVIPIFEMLKDENRQTILMILFDHGEQTVSQLTEKMSLSRPTISYHLKLLLQAGLVSVTKIGKERYYRVTLEDTGQLLKELIISLENEMPLSK